MLCGGGSSPKMGHELCWMGAARACLIWEVVLGPVRRIYNVGKELVTPGLKQGWGRQVPSSGTLQVCYRAYHTMCRAWTRPEVRGRVVWVTVIIKLWTSPHLCSLTLFSGLGVRGE